MSGTVKVVQVGCGGISAAWLRPATERDDVEIVGLVDLKEEAAHRRADEFGLREAVVGTDLGAVLERTKPEVVFNSTVPEAHMPVTVQALEGGCHVLCEKPMADTIENARRMVAAARRTGRVCAVSQSRRFDPRILRLRRFIESGAIGPLTTVHSRFLLGAHFGGFRDRMEHVLLLDMAIHTFDAARYLVRADAGSVYCHEWNPSGSWFDHGASAVCVFEMAGGVVYTYEGSWCSEGLNTPWESTWHAIGEKGSVSWDGADGFRAQLVVKAEGFRSELEDVEVPEAECNDAPVGIAGAIDDFLAALREDREPESVCTDNITSLAMVHGAVESARAGARVPVVHG